MRPGRRRRGGVRLAGFVAGVLLLLASSGFPKAHAKGSLQDVEREFREAISKVTPVTVVCVPHGVAAEVAGSSSGVIVSKDGWVLSDGDVGASQVRQGDRVDVAYSDDVEVRVPDLEQGGFAAYRAAVVRRERSTDSALLRILDPPAGGFRDFLPPATSRDVRVGMFAFAMGNAFGLSQEAPPTLTAGLVSSLTYLPPEDGGGRIEFVYTSAAVNPGVNGGPVVDVEGRLIGTVSTWLQPVPGEPYQFLGKVVPIDRIRAVYSDLAEARSVFEALPEGRERAPASAALERVFKAAARAAYPAVVGLAVERSTPLSTRSLGSGGLGDVARWGGAVSGVLLDGDGWIVTSLYNLTNVIDLIAPAALRPPTANLSPEVGLETGLRAITAVTVHLPRGDTAPARVVAHDGRLGIALLKADFAAGGATRPAETLRGLEAAPADSFAEGRFVLALGNPFGPAGNPDPLLTFGILSKQHADDIPAAWRGQWQTDAGVTDANCGGALVDLQGRLLGVLQIWQPLRHGRNSGIGFVVPWPRIAQSLPRLKEGFSPRPGLLGIRFEPTPGGARIQDVTEGSAAHKAGLRAGDQVLALDGYPTPDIQALVARLAYRWEGETVRLLVRRGDAEREVAVVLDPRPAQG